MDRSRTERARVPVARPFFYPTPAEPRNAMDAKLLRLIGPVTMAFRCRDCERTSAWEPTCFSPGVKCVMCDAPHDMDWSRVGSA